MGINLTIDRGNTMTKIAIWDGDRQLSNCSIVKATTPAILRAIASYDIDRAIICSVAGRFAGLDEELAAIGVSLVNLSADTPVPIAIDYATPATIGADRIAAATGAFRICPGKECLIVDIGTAITYDRLTAAGRFIGGNIAPGIGMRLKALNHFTARLPLIRSNGPTKLWGDSTETAMRAGAIYGVAGEISYYRSKLPEGATVILTGGWSTDIASLLDFPVTVDNSLVTTGLNCILQYNENK